MLYLLGRFTHNVLMLKGVKAVQSNAQCSEAAFPQMGWVDPLSSVSLYLWEYGSRRVG